MVFSDDITHIVIVAYLTLYAPDSKSLRYPYLSTPFSIPPPSHRLKIHPLCLGAGAPRDRLEDTLHRCSFTHGDRLIRKQP